jgi:branched-chain amino acid transport system ATP-binding protein
LKQQESILKVEKLWKSFGGVAAVSDIDLSARKGEISSIIGPNGAGKTTLFHLITKRISPDSGRVLFNGEDISKLTPETIYHKGLSRTFQITSIFGKLTALENVKAAIVASRKRNLHFFSRTKRLFGEEALSLLEAVGLSAQAENTANALAHGDRKRLELAIALASEPELLLLDEPAAGLSVDESTIIMELIGRLARERGMTLIFIEHDMSIVFAVSEKIRVMHFGRMIAEGTPHEIKNNTEVQKIYLGET